MSKFIQVHFQRVWYKNKQDKFPSESDLSYKEPQPRLFKVDLIRSVGKSKNGSIVYTETTAFEVTEDFDTLAGLLEAVGVGRNEQ
jgi:hypothetical protein